MKCEVIIKTFIIKAMKILRKDIKDSTVESLVQFIMFSAVGATNTIISYVINIAVLTFMRPYSISWDYIIGNMVAFVLSVLWSFYWNNRLVFTQKGSQKRNLWKALLKAYVAYGFTGIILNNILSWLWITVLYISKYIAPLINLIISVPLNFVINKVWTFGEGKD